MKLNMTTAIALALSLATLANSASAATVAEGWTRKNNQYFTSDYGLTAEDTNGVSANASGNPYALASSLAGVTDAAGWVWGSEADTNSPNRFAVNYAVYRFTFDLTGYDVSTAAVSGQWAADNYAYIAINPGDIYAGGSTPITFDDAMNDLDVIASLAWDANAAPQVNAANHAFLSSYGYGAGYGTGDTSFFNAGINELVFVVFDSEFNNPSSPPNQSAGGLLASSFVTAQAAEVLAPMPLPAGAMLGLSGLALLAGVGRRRRKA